MLSLTKSLLVLRWSLRGGLILVGLLNCPSHAQLPEKVLLADANTLYDVVVQGIFENCRKFDCGALTWQMEQRSHDSGRENGRDAGQQGVHRMWWDGRKVATRATTCDVAWHGQKAKRGGESTDVKVYDGNEYRGMIVAVPHIVLAKQPRFSQFDNYLENYGWPGHSKSIVDRLADDMKNGQVSLEWSIVERNGTRQIRLKRSTNAVPNCYKAYYFDPTKGCMLVQDEFYNKNELTYVCTWTLKEVSQGMWFPVEANQHGKIVYPKGANSLQYTTRLAVDIKQSRFNDHSAIPQNAFELEITPDINVIIDHRLGDPPVIYQGEEIGEFLKQGRQASSVLVAVGKQLPEFEGIKLKLSAEETKDKAILLCFFDMNQRPSRYCVRQLAQKAAELKEKGITVAAVQASEVSEKTLNEWIKKSNVLFPIGVITADIQKTRFAWGGRSLPRLILTDKQHVVTAENFSLAELDEKLGSNSQN